MTGPPPPFTPPGCDLRDFASMFIDIARLFNSEFHATANAEQWRAGVTLWLKSWHQVPAASLPAGDVPLARLAELGTDIRAWRRVRDVALQGWILCADGRLYHRVVAEKALEAYLGKLAQRLASGAGNASRWDTGFDPTPIRLEIEATATMLLAIAPHSGSLAKARRSLSRRTPDGSPDGTASGSGGGA